MWNTEAFYQLPKIWQKHGEVLLRRCANSRFVEVKECREGEKRESPE